MSKFHSTVTRRDFMKGLGLAGAGIGAAAAAAPVFHDLDEVSSSSLSTLKYPWYVKSVDKPTVEIDWGLMKPYDATEMTFGAKGPALFAEAVGGADVVAQWNADQNERRKQYRAAGEPGYTVEDMALGAGRNLWGDFSNPTGWGFLGRRTATPPDGYGLTAGNVVCIYCMTPIPIETLGREGGCNPIPLEAAISDTDIRITVEEIDRMWKRVLSGEFREGI